MNPWEAVETAITLGACAVGWLALAIRHHGVRHRRQRAGGPSARCGRLPPWSFYCAASFGLLCALLVLLRVSVAHVPIRLGVALLALWGMTALALTLNYFYEVDE